MRKLSMEDYDVNDHERMRALYSDVDRMGQLYPLCEMMKLNARDQRGLSLAPRFFCQLFSLLLFQDGLWAADTVCTSSAI